MGGNQHTRSRSALLIAPDVDPVQHQQVEMDVQFQRADEALDQGHGARLRGGVSIDVLSVGRTTARQALECRAATTSVTGD